MTQDNPEQHPAASPEEHILDAIFEAASYAVEHDSDYVPEETYARWSAALAEWEGRHNPTPLMQTRLDFEQAMREGTEVAVWLGDYSGEPDVAGHVVAVGSLHATLATDRWTMGDEDVQTIRLDGVAHLIEATEVEAQPREVATCTLVVRYYTDETNGGELADELRERMDIVEVEAHPEDMLNRESEEDLGAAFYPSDEGDWIVRNRATGYEARAEDEAQARLAAELITRGEETDPREAIAMAEAWIDDDDTELYRRELADAGPEVDNLADRIGLPLSDDELGEAERYAAEYDEATCSWRVTDGGEFIEGVIFPTQLDAEVHAQLLNGQD